MPARMGDYEKSSFQRGMLFNFSDHAAPQDSVKFLDNMLQSPISGLSSRAGRTRRQDTVIGDVVYNVFRWKGSDSSFRDIVAHKSGANMVYGHADGTGALNNTIGSLTDGGAVLGFQKDYRLYISNGNDPVKVYVFDGTVQTRDVGIPDGPAATAAVNVTGGNLNGSYEYVVTVTYGADGESNPGTSDSAAPVNEQVNVSWSAPTPPAGMDITLYNIYRKNPGETFFRYVDSVNVGTTSYTDNVTDGTVNGGDIVEDNHNATPSKLTGITWWDHEQVALAWGENATVGSDVFPNRVFISDVGRTEIWKTTADTNNVLNTARFIDVPARSLDNPVVSIFVDKELAYVFNRKGVRVLRPTGTAQSFTVDVVANSEDHGIIGPAAVTATDTGDVYYVSTDGLRLIRNGVDLEVLPNTDDGKESLITTGKLGQVGVSLNSIIDAIPQGMRQHVYAHEFKDRIHISLATSAVSGVTPTMNNDVLIFDTSTRSFTYSTNRNVYGWATINDSGNNYDLLSCGYTTPASDPTDFQGNVWNEYQAGSTSDEDASGTSVSIPCEVTDFHRSFAGLRSMKLRYLFIDAASTGGTITVKTTLDSGRFSTTKQFTYPSSGLTAWQGQSYWQSDPANDLSNDSGFGDGSALTTFVALFTAISDGEFRIVVDAVNKDITGLDFTSDTTIENIVSTINSALDTASVSVRCDFVKSPGYFRFTHDTFGASGSVTDVVTIGGGGTNIATAALLGTGANEIVYQASNVPSPKIGLEWWGLGVADTEAVKHDWSSVGLTRGKIMAAQFHGERCNMFQTTVTCDSPFELYGYSYTFQVEKAINGGVL